MSDLYRQLVDEAKSLSTKQLETMGIEIVWRGSLIGDRAQEPVARPIVVRGMNGLFPGYVYLGNHVIFDMIVCENIEQGQVHAEVAMRSVMLNE